MTTAPGARAAGTRCAGLAVALALGCTGGAGLPLPSTYEAHDPAVRSQIAGLERRARTLEAESATNAELAAAIGELGRLYHGVQLLDTHAFNALEAAEHCYREAHRLDPSDHRWPYLSGFAAQSQGNLDAAAAAYRSVLAIEPDLIPALHRLAETEAARGRPDEAAAQWNRALELEPGFAPALYGLGALALDRGDARTAAEHLEGALATQPGAGRGHYSLGMAYRLLGDEERAAEHLARASHADFSLDDPLVRELAYLPAGSAALVQQGLIAVQAGEFVAAATLFGRAVEADPTNVEARRQLALAQVDAGQPELAQATYEELLSLDPTRTSAHLELAQLLASRGRPDEAIRRLLRATELAPDYKQAHYQLALLFDRTGRPGEALTRYDRVLALDPDFGEAATRRAATLAALGRPAEAIRILKARTAAAPTDGAALVALSVVLRQQNRLAEARTILESALASGGFSPAGEARLRTELGGIFAIQGRLRDAAKELQTARQLNPTEAQTSFMLGMVQADLGRTEEAVRALAAALAVRPDLTPGPSPPRLSFGPDGALHRSPATPRRRPPADSRRTRACPGRKPTSDHLRPSLAPRPTGSRVARVAPPGSWLPPEAARKRSGRRPAPIRGAAVTRLAHAAVRRRPDAGQNPGGADPCVRPSSGARMPGRRTRSAEDDGPVLHDEDAMFEMGLHGTREHHPLQVPAATHESRHRIAVTDPRYVLLDDRSLIEFRRRIVRRRADDLDSAQIRLPVRAAARERRQKGVVDVDHPGSESTRGSVA